MNSKPETKSTQVVKYSDLFEDNRPNIDAILKDISSIYVIVEMTFVNDALESNGNDFETQLFILESMCSGISERDKISILSKGKERFAAGYKLFGYPYTVELLNREFSNFRKGTPRRPEDTSGDTIKILKSYVSLVTEIAEKEFTLFNSAYNRLKANTPFLQIMWPHLIKQQEFVSMPDVIYESFRGFSLLNFLERHPKYGDIVKSYLQSMRCNSGSEYQERLIALFMPHIKKGKSLVPKDHFVRIRLSDYQPIIESLFINIEEIRNSKSKQLDYNGMKECPLFALSPTEFIVPFWYYFYGALYNGIIFSFYKKSGIASLFEKKGAIGSKSESGLGNFKSKFAKEFSEAILFKDTMTKCFKKEGSSLMFFDDNEKFNPDCYYRRGNDVFIIEFKDSLLNSEVIQSGSYEQIREAIDTKLVLTTNVKTGKISEKGIYQLARQVEILANQPDKVRIIDEDARIQGIELKNMSIFPIIVHTNNYFDIPAVNEYLDEKIQSRLSIVSSCFKSIEPFTMINFSYFFYKILLFSDSKLHLADEIRYYHTSRKQLKEKAKRTDLMSDWLNAFSPFASVNSPVYEAGRIYRRDELILELRKLWNIHLPSNLVHTK